jgi:hypothetical protein
LQAGATYHYRVVAVNSAGTVDGPDLSFTTVPPAQIDSVTISNVTGAGATVHALINPLGRDTKYHFEYGSSTSYGASVPVPDADIGAGEADVAVSQQLTGLAANTTYHVRVVATNALGTERSGDHTFVYDTSGGGLPDGREYEMVTPPRKNGALVSTQLFGANAAFGVSEDGSRVILPVIQCFAGAGSCTGDRFGAGEPFAFIRTDDGWVTTPLAPAATQVNVDTYLLSGAEEGVALFSIPTPPSDEDDLYARQFDGSLVDVGPETPPSEGPHFPAFNGGEIAATADLSHVVLTLSHDWPFDYTLHNGFKYSLYEYVGSGNAAPVLVGVSGGPGSTDLISVCGTELGGTLEDAHEFGSAMSADGGTVYFTADACTSGSGANAGVPVPAATLYARVDESRTVPISIHAPEPVCGAVCQVSPAGYAQFEGASVDGSKVFFTSTQQLTNGASEDSQPGDIAENYGCRSTVSVNGCNLYEYDFDAPAGRNLIAVSAGDTSGGGPRVREVAAISADGSHVYFTAQGVLTGAANSQGQTARDGAENLYVFERDAQYPEGHVAFVATIGALSLGANVTPDGHFLVFGNRGDLTTDDTSTTGAVQVFRYDAQTGDLVRISIGERGYDDNGNADVADAGFALPIEFAYAGPVRRDPTMSDDGSYVFFESPVGLTPQALNEVPTESGALAENVYEWHEGQVYLISDGRDTSDTVGGSSVRLLGTDASGADVFFTTADRLVAQDTDTESDVYDARVCTVSEPCVTTPPPVSPCGGEACHGTPGAAPQTPVGATVAFSGPGNLAAPALVVKPKAKHTRRAHGKAKRKTKAKKPKPRKATRGKKHGKAAKTGKRGGRGGK